MKRKTWYPLEDGKAVIEIKVETIRQLFDERDPTPFRLRDLDDDAVEYIISSAEEIGPENVGKIRIMSVCAVDKNTYEVITNSVKDHFLYRCDITRKKLKAIFRLGFKSLLIGILFLSFAVFTSGHVGSMIPENFWGKLFKEGFLLLGWVSMWKPINIFLYEWWPLKDLISTYEIVADLKVEVAQIETSADGNTRATG